MASAISLNAQATILNGQGFSINSNVAAAITSFSNLPAVSLVNDIFTLSMGANYSDLSNVVEVLGSGASSTNKYLLDFYPSNVTPSTTCSSSVTVYGNTSATSSVIKTFSTQANLPFAHGLPGFANVVTRIRGHSAQSFDTVASIKMIGNTSIAQSGLGYKSISDLASGGIGSNGKLLGSVVSNFGTMYDVQKINLIADPYAFGQNLLNQGLGRYGNLSVNITNAGLDVADITKIPDTKTTITQQSSTLSKPTPVGQIDLPTITNVSTTQLVTGNSVDVLMNIYRQVKGDDLAAIVSATGITATGILKPTTLADYMNIDAVVDVTTKSQLSVINIRSLSDLGKYLHSKIGQGSFVNWKKLGTVLSSIEAPTLQYTTSSPNSPILNPAAVALLNTNNATGSGDLGTAMMSDYIGACYSDKYVTWINAMIDAYHRSNMAPVEASLRNLKQAINTWIGGITSGTDMDGGLTISYPPVTPVESAVASAIAAINAVPSYTTHDGLVAQYAMLNSLAKEVSNLTAAEVVFKADPYPTQTIKSFSQSVSTLIKDRDQSNAYQLIVDTASHDAAGDTIRALIAEVNNQDILISSGIPFSNDPNPALAIRQAKMQNIPLSTYLTQNK